MSSTLASGHAGAVSDDAGAMPYDAIVVGASFAGLSFAGAAAARGMRAAKDEEDGAGDRDQADDEVGDELRELVRDLARDRHEDDKDAGAHDIGEDDGAENERAGDRRLHWRCVFIW